MRSDDNHEKKRCDREKAKGILRGEQNKKI